jgi:signal transduction histidine kinase
MTTFKAKARAVELLGKGQIADLPTAISELWKNGYDAYARNLVCKLYLQSYKDNTTPLFLLSDDGYGMSELDILNKWFVLGTDSKAHGETTPPYFGLRPRVQMGEKGIGRLSVSYLGNEMLMLTKKQNQQAYAILMDWRVLDNYNFFLSDLNIPLFGFSTIKDFNISLERSKDEFKSNLQISKWIGQTEVLRNITINWEQLHLPKFIYEEVINSFCETSYHGTSFIILTPHEQLLELSEKDRVQFKEDSSLRYLRASLSGLHNDLKDPKKDFETHFFIYDNAGKYDVIDDFFTQEEMRSADHWLKGSFDQTGFFSGEIRIFDKKFKHTFRPNRPPGETSYGPFSIEWGFVEGALANSRLNEEQFRIINEKLQTYGGLYIYRDNFRVLPYGRTESDFLEFEKRRSLGAGYYFFSHRRFIGYIDLSRVSNYELKDKAGREGFIQNKAYREFRDDLVSFFIDISRRYLRRTGEDDEVSFRESQLKEINAKYFRQQKAEKKKNAKTKKAFIDQLNERKEKLPILLENVRSIYQDLQKEVTQLTINYNNYNRLLTLLEEKKNEIKFCRITKPRAVNIAKKQEVEFNSFQKNYIELESEVQHCDDIIEQTRSRISLENLRAEYNEKFRLHIKQLESIFSDFQTKARDSFHRIAGLLSEERDIQLNAFKERTLSLRIVKNDSKEEIASKISALDLLINEQNIDIDNSIGGFINHLLNLQIDVDDDFLRNWYQDQNQKLEKRLTDYEELAQLGISIEIIDHQFNVMYAQMNDAISQFSTITKINPAYDYSFKQLKNAFQHLEGNYKLLRPLYRTSRRTREIITGEQIGNYVSEFFSNEFERYQIQFSVNDAFRSYHFFTYDSIIKPVFLNLINNANYWLIPVDNRKIRIEYDSGNILVMNSGEKIEDSYLEDIFTLFFTRKKDGRGIGLYLAKKNLNAIGYDIYATNRKDYNKLNGACFVITKVENEI